MIKQGIDKARKMFLDLKEKYPADEVEKGINTLGYAFLNAEKYDDAIAHDPHPDKDFLERLKKGAQDNLKKLEKKNDTQLPPSLQ